MLSKYRVIHSPSGISDLCGTVAGMVTPKGSMSTEGERLQVSVLPYRCSICPSCCVCLRCCAAELGSSGGTYGLPCTIWLKDPLGVHDVYYNLWYVKPNSQKLMFRSHTSIILELFKYIGHVNFMLFARGKAVGARR